MIRTSKRKTCTQSRLSYFLDDFDRDTGLKTNAAKNALYKIGNLFGTSTSAYKMKTVVARKQIHAQNQR